MSGGMSTWRDDGSVESKRRLLVESGRRDTIARVCAEWFSACASRESRYKMDVQTSEYVVWQANTKRGR